MTALCPAWADTCQTMCLGCSLEQLRPDAFRLPKPKNGFPMLPTCRITARVTGTESPRLETLHGGFFKRQVDGTDSARLTILTRILCGPIVCNPRSPASFGAKSCSNNTAELTGFAEALRWIMFFIPRGERVRILYDSKRAARVALGFIHAVRNIALVHNCNELVSRSKCNFRISVDHVFRPAGKARNGCADIAASLGMRGFISESNVLSCWPTRHFHVQRLLKGFLLPFWVAEVLHSIVAGIAVGTSLCLLQLFFLRNFLLHTVRFRGFSMSDSLIWFSSQLAHPFQPNVDVHVVARSEAPKCEGDRRSPSAWECHVQCTRFSLCRQARRGSRHNACGPSSTRRCEPVPGHWLQQLATSHAVESVQLPATATTG